MKSLYWKILLLVVFAAIGLVVLQKPKPPVATAPVFAVPKNLEVSSIGEEPEESEDSVIVFQSQEWKGSVEFKAAEGMVSRTLFVKNQKGESVPLTEFISMPEFMKLLLKHALFEKLSAEEKKEISALASLREFDDWARKKEIQTSESFDSDQMADEDCGSQLLFNEHDYLFWEEEGLKFIILAVGHPFEGSCIGVVNFIKVYLPPRTRTPKDFRPSRPLREILKDNHFHEVQSVWAVGA